MGWTTLICVYLCVVAANFVHGKSEKYVVEIYFVFDQQAFANYKRENANTAVGDALKDMNYFLTLANERLASLLKDDLDIQLKILKTEVTDDIYQSSSDTVNSPEKMLEAFNDWLETTQAKDQIGYDFAVYFTGHKLSLNNPGQCKGTICGKDPENSQYPVAVVPFDGTPFMVNALLKNIGFILGAGKDGSGSFNIMRSLSFPEASEESYSFSSCTAFDIKEFFAARDVSCLLQTSSVGSFPSTTTEFYKGRITDPDVICERAEHPKSLVCRVPHLWGVQELGGDPVCQRLYCRSEKDIMKCTRTWPIDGMRCGPDKICRKGKCVDDEFGHVDPVLEGCVFGDEKLPVIGSQKKTCATLFVEEGSPMCYNIAHICCETCRKYKTNIANCDWGDKSLIVNRQPSSCGKYLGSNGMSKCRNSVVASICCKSCGDWLANNPGKRELTNGGVTVDDGLNDAIRNSLFDQEGGDVLDPRLTTIDEDGQVISAPTFSRGGEVHELLQNVIDIEP